MNPEEKKELLIEREPWVFSGEALAGELGLKEFRLPNELYEAADKLIALLYDKVITPTYQMGPSEMGQYFAQHKSEIVSYFESLPQVWRLPLLLRESSFSEQALSFARFHDIEPKISFDAFFYCMHFYLHLSTFRNARKLAKKHPKGHPVFSIKQLIQDEMESELSSAWWNKSAYFFSQLFPDETEGRRLWLEELWLEEPAWIPYERLAEYCAELVRFLQKRDLGPERILINPLSRVKWVTFVDKANLLAERDADGISFFLCQDHLFLYDISFQKLLNHPDQHSAWVIWIKRHIQFLVRNNSQVTIAFKTVFNVRGDIFSTWWEGLTRQGRDKIPEILQKAILDARKQFRDEEKSRRKVEKPHQVVAQIQSPRPAQTSMAVLATLAPQKEIVVFPHINVLFPGLDEAKAWKKQLEKVDFSQCHFPEWTIISLERALPGKKQIFQPLPITDINGLNSIVSVIGRAMAGHFAYRLAITLPSTHRFDGKNSVEVAFYVKTEPTPEEQLQEEEQRLALLARTTVTPPEPVALIVEEVVEKVEIIIDPAETSLIAATFVLEENLQKYSHNDAYEGGPIEIIISDADAVAILGDEAKNLLPEHRTWIIREDDTVHPPTNDGSIHNHLLTIAGALRAKAQTKIQKQQEQEKQTREQAEYEQERLKFEPILEFARWFQFDGKQNGHFEDQKRVLIEELRALGWSLPVTWSWSQVIWRHTGPKVRIIYTSKQCISFAVNGEQSELTWAQKKCYEEVAQAFAHIARFFNVEAKERTRMVNKEKTIRKETETGAVAYDKLLQEGRARLVLFGPYQGWHGVWSSKFPTEKTPFMLDERASYGTIESLLQQYPHAELCYRRDQLCINGEIAQDASQESIENVSLNVTELRQSPRARYILKKRILITLKFEKFSGETDRAPIKHEKNKKEGGISALDILQRIQKERSVQSASDITEDFLNCYIDELERNRIRVHYVWPLSARLDEHQARMKKYAAKRASQTEATAD